MERGPFAVDDVDWARCVAREVDATERHLRSQLESFLLVEAAWCAVGLEGLFERVGCRARRVGD